MKPMYRLTILFASILGIVGLCFFMRWFDKVDGYREAHEYLSEDIHHGSPERVKSWFLDTENREWGIRINERLADDSTWLMMATEVGRLETVKALLDVGADVNMRDKTGRTALQIADQKGYSEIVRMLIKAGANE